MGLVASLVGLVEGYSVLLLLEGYFGLDSCFVCVPVLSSYSC